MAAESTPSHHVLVIDDEPDFAALLASFLTKAGYSVATAHTCEEALAAARKRKPDLVTLDISMPRKSGVFFYRQFKGEKRFRYVPVVVLTGITRNDKEMENIVRTLLDPGDLPPPEAYLEKPIDGQQFLKTVASAIGAESAGPG